MSKKKLKIIGTIIAFLLCFPLHFLYDKFPNFITSVFGPVNESIWEHMKILFGGILLSGVIQKIIAIVKKENYNNICFSNFVAGIVSIPIFLVLFLPVYYVIGENMPVTIFIMFIAIVIAEVVSYLIMKKHDLGLEKITIFFVIIMYIIFTFLSYFPPRTEIFLDPKEEIYGINK